jgi:glycosyltransferase involved in cell wall biosynthesis
MAKRIDVIIPAYKAHGTMFRALSSIACQSILDQISVTIVNDCCPEGDYSSFVDLFSPFFDIKEVKLEKNGGPGVARQFGIDNSSAEWFTCMDADDTLIGSLALEQLLGVADANPSVVNVVGTFLQLCEGSAPLKHEADSVWMFGKLYKRSFIEKYNIRFNETRANEDTGFNKKVNLICSASQNEDIANVDIPVYYWHEKVDSITRVNNGQYSYDQSFCGWTDNMIDAYQFCKRVTPFNGEVDKFCVGVMYQLYTYYIEVVGRNPVFAAQDWEYVKKFYHTCFAPLWGSLSDDVKAEAYNEAMTGVYVKQSWHGIIPSMSITEFFDKLSKEPYDPNDIYSVYADLPSDLIANNIACGVCEENYTTPPSDISVSAVSTDSADMGSAE